MNSGLMDVRNATMAFLGWLFGTPIPTNMTLIMTDAFPTKMTLTASHIHKSSKTIPTVSYVKMAIL